MEKEFAHKVITRLQKYFVIREERWSKCRKYRIDYILNDRKNEDVYFGVEFKDFDAKKGEGIGEHILQSIRYSQSEFEIEPNIYKQIPILICPPISYHYLMCPIKESKTLLNAKYDGKEINKKVEYFHDRHEKENKHHTVNGILGVFNIGEIRTTLWSDKQKIWFCFSNWIVWSELMNWNDNIRGYDDKTVRGLDAEKYDKLMNKIKKFKLLP